MALEGIFGQLQDMGLFDAILPFMLVFALVYAILTKVKLFGDNSKNYNIIIALVMGLSVVFPHELGYYPPGKDIVVIINTAIPNVSVVVVAIVMALLIIGLLGRKFDIGGGSLSGWLAIAAFGVIIYIFGSAADWWHLPDWLSMLNNPDTMSLVIVILVFAIIIWFITKDNAKKTDYFKLAGEKVGSHLQEIKK